MSLRTRVGQCVPPTAITIYQTQDSPFIPICPGGKLVLTRERCTQGIAIGGDDEWNQRMAIKKFISSSSLSRNDLQGRWLKWWNSVYLHMRPGRRADHRWYDTKGNRWKLSISGGPRFPFPINEYIAPGGRLGWSDQQILSPVGIQLLSFFAQVRTIHSFSTLRNVRAKQGVLNWLWRSNWLSDEALRLRSFEAWRSVKWMR